MGATDHEAVAGSASITPAGALAFIVASNLYIPVSPHQRPAQ
ncbi:MAG: hypothetical protein ACLSAH_14580 [Bilophila wadsworthia]